MGEVALDQGLLTEQEVEKRGLNHILTSAIGAEISPSIGLIDLEPGDVVLLCTDGLTKHVTDEAIQAILHAGESAEDSCERLVLAALDGGGSDNVTMIVAKAVGR
jgi:protein phosphatase